MCAACVRQIVASAHKRTYVCACARSCARAIVLVRRHFFDQLRLAFLQDALQLNLTESAVAWHGIHS